MGLMLFQNGKRTSQKLEALNFSETFKKPGQKHLERLLKLNRQNAAAEDIA